VWLLGEAELRERVRGGADGDVSGDNGGEMKILKNGANGSVSICKNFQKINGTCCILKYSVFPVDVRWMYFTVLGNKK